MQTELPNSIVLLSYSNSDADLAFTLSADLADYGLDVWLEHIDFTQPIDFPNLVEQCHVFIPILSDKFSLIESKWCRLQQLPNRAYITLLPIIRKPCQLPNTIPAIDFSGWHNEFIYRDRLKALLDLLSQSASIEANYKPDPETQYINHTIADIKQYRAFLEKISAHSDTLPSDKRTIYSQSMWGLTGEFEVLTPQDSSGVISSTYQFHDILAAYPRFLLLGPSGAGKTITLYRALLDALRAYQSNRYDNPIPLLVHLGIWEHDISIEDLIQSQWSLDSDPLTLAAEGKLLLLLDGLDEVGKSQTNKINSLKAWLNCERAPQKIVITCQQDLYPSDIGLPTVLLKEIDPPRIRQYIFNHLNKPFAENLLEQVLPKKSAGTALPINHLARNALMLGLMAAAAQNDSSAGVPQHEALLLQWAITRLWHQHVETLPFEQAFPTLSRLAYDTIADDLASHFSFEYALLHLGEETVLQHALDTSILRMRDGLIHFSHRKIRDFLATRQLLVEGVYTRLTRAHFGSDYKRLKSKWESVVVLCSGLVSNSSEFIRTIAQVNPFLALECIASGINVSDPVLTEVIDHLIGYTVQLGSNQFDILQHLLPTIVDAQAASTLLENLHRKLKPTGEYTSQTADEELIMLLKKLGTDVVRILIEALRGDKWQRRSSAAWALGELREPMAVPSLIEALRDESEDVRKEAVLALTRIGKPALPRLLKALEDPDPDLRAVVIKLLSHLNDVSAVPSLITCLKDTSWPSLDEARICDLAANALETIGTDDALQAVDIWRQGGRPLKHQSNWGDKIRDNRAYQIRSNQTSQQLLADLQSHDWKIRREAVGKLGEGGNPVALPYIVQAVHDQDSQVRWTAVKALQSFTGQDAISALLEALHDEEAVVSDAAAEALAAIGKPAFEKLVHLLTDDNPTVRGAVVEILGKIGDEEAIPLLVDALADRMIPHLETRRICDIAAESLENIGTEKALFALNQWRKEQGIDYGLPIGELETSLLYFDSLGQANDRAALLAFLDSLHTSDWHAKRKAAQQLREFVKTLKGTSETHHAVEKLSSALDDEQSLVRWTAAEALASIGDNHAADALLSALDDTSWTVRLEAVRALSEIESPIAIPGLLKSLNDPSHLVREAAATALGKIGDVTVADALVKALRDPDSFVQRAAVQALGRVGDSLVVPELINLLADADYHVRWAIVETLGEIGDPSAIPALITCLNDMSSPEWEEKRLCDIAAAALKSIGTQPAQEALERLHPEEFE